MVISWGKCAFRGENLAWGNCSFRGGNLAWVNSIFEMGNMGDHPHTSAIWLYMTSNGGNIPDCRLFRPVILPDPLWLTLSRCFVYCAERQLVGTVS